MVAAGAVVTKDIPPLSVAGGVPAEVIRPRGAAEPPEDAAATVASPVATNVAPTVAARPT